MKKRSKATINRLALCLGLMVIITNAIQINSGQPIPPAEEFVYRGEGDLNFAASAPMLEMSYPPKGIPIGFLISGRGFALKDNETHVLKANVERLMPLEPMAMRKVLAYEKNIEDIRNEIRVKEGKAVYHGTMLLDRKFYPLVNIDVFPPDDNNDMLLTAAVADHNLEYGDEETIMVVGNMTLTIVPSVNGDLVGEGKLIINSVQHSGTYRILLDILPPPPEGLMPWDI